MVKRNTAKRRSMAVRAMTEKRKNKAGDEDAAGANVAFA